MFSDLVTLNYQGSSISKPVPVWIAPGQPDDVVTIFLGYGRTRAGRVGTGLGYDAFEVMRSDAMNFGFGSIAKTGDQSTIASTQIHFNMEGRDIVRVWDFNDLENEIEHVTEKNEDTYPKSMYKTAADEYQKQYDKTHRWGMSIDLNSCVGCNACVLACQSENNIPVVGKEQVERSREMHWLRIDTYFGGADLSKPDGPHFQPILCQQCEQAPCEDTVLLEQLPVQSTTLQLYAVPGLGHAAVQVDAQPGSLGSQPRCHGKVHLLYPANFGGTHRGRKRRATGRRR
jgi:molybdopterin-containing oxidoreductase family iron-sulfur binding subunit